MGNTYWECERLLLPLKYTWKISRNASDEKNNLLVLLHIEGKTYAGEAAPNIRYGETIELIESQFVNFSKVWEHGLLLDENKYNEVLDSLHLCQSLRFALESAYVHARCDKDSQFFERYTGLALNTAPLATSYTLPIIQMHFLVTRSITMVLQDLVLMIQFYNITHLKFLLILEQEDCCIIKTFGLDLVLII